MINQPNVLLLTLDTLRADRLGCYGHPGDISPYIDRLATASVRFEQAITGGSWTQAAFPVLLTSTHASLYGGCLGPLSRQRPSPVAALANHGYQTAAFSTSPLLSCKYRYDRGFHHFVDLEPVESDPLIRHMKGGERLLRAPLTHRIARLLGRGSRPAGLYVSGSDLTDHLCDWLQTTNGPFFAWAHYMDIHWPYHREETLTEPGEIAQAWRDLGHMHVANWKGGALTPAQQARFIDLYEQAVQYTDAQIGRLLNTLEQLGLRENTIIILVSDHGEEFLERRHWGHFEVNLYDEILKIPLIIHLPGVHEGQTVTRQVRTLDLMPTILNLCGCPPPEGMEGESLVPLWDGCPETYEAELAISEMWRTGWHIIAVRTEMFKYIWDSKRPEQTELYHLPSDPEERHNVRSRYPEEVHRFQAVVDAHLQRAVRTSGPDPAGEVEADEVLVQRLRGLGYLE